MTDERGVYDDSLTGPNSERELWCAVLLVAVEDAVRGANGKDRAYVLKPNADFNEVCALAGLDPEAVRQGVVARIAAEALVVRPAGRRDSKLYHFEGRALTAQGWADELGLPVQALRARLYQHWPVEKALTTPFMGRRKRTPGVGKNLPEKHGDRRGVVRATSTENRVFEIEGAE